MLKKFHERYSKIEWILIIPQLLSAIPFYFDLPILGSILIGLPILVVLLYVIFSKNNKKDLTISDIKNELKVLFIDDQDNEIVKTLTVNGIKTRIIGDPDSLQDRNIKWANIIFVDYEGIGSLLKTGRKQGIGVIRLLEKEYGNSKRYILYSGSGDFQDELKGINFVLKNEDFHEVVELIKEEYQQL